MRTPKEHNPDTADSALNSHQFIFEAGAFSHNRGSGEHSPAAGTVRDGSPACLHILCSAKPLLLQELQQLITIAPKMGNLLQLSC